MPPPPPTGKINRRVWLLVCGVVAVLVVAGVVIWLAFPSKSPGRSTHTSSGSRSSTPAGPTITGETVKKVLLDGDELTAMLDQPFKVTMLPMTYGGPDKMGDSSVTGDCAGVVSTGAKTVYSSADVQNYAQETWAEAEIGDEGYNPFNSRVLFVDEAVVALPSAEAAQTLFATFVEQWKRCDGQTVTETIPGPTDDDLTFQRYITKVRVTGTILAASILNDKDDDAPSARAIGIQGNCLVEVDIPFVPASESLGNLDQIGSADPDTSGTAVAQAMMDKAAKLG